MRKLLSLLLALSLLCAGVALAEEHVITPDTPSQSTTVTFDMLEPETAYIVNIPSTVSFDEGTNTTSMTVTIEAGSTLAEGATLKVTLESSANSFQLKQEDNAIAYEIRKNGSNLSAGSEVLAWTQGEAIPEAATLNLEVTGSTDGLPTGAYADTLTFKATVSTGSFSGEHEGFEDGDPVIWD